MRGDYVPTAENVMDIFIKALLRELFFKYQALLVVSKRTVKSTRRHYNMAKFILDFICVSNSAAMGRNLKV